MSNKIVKSVSFNFTNPQEKAFLDRLEEERIEFSGYIKELIFSQICSDAMHRSKSSNGAKAGATK